MSCVHATRGSAVALHHSRRGISTGQLQRNNLVPDSGLSWEILPFTSNQENEQAGNCTSVPQCKRAGETHSVGYSGEKALACAQAHRTQASSFKIMWIVLGAICTLGKFKGQTTSSTPIPFCYHSLFLSAARNPI